MCSTRKCVLLGLCLLLGEFGDAQLPAKKSFGTKNIDFLESKKASLEHYLQVGDNMTKTYTGMDKTSLYTSSGTLFVSHSLLREDVHVTSDVIPYHCLA